MDEQTLDGVRLLTVTAVTRRDAAALDAVDGFVTRQRAAAEELRTHLEGAGEARAARSVALLDEVDRRSKALRPLVRCGAVGPADRLGPTPAADGSCRSRGPSTGPSPAPATSGAPPGGGPTTPGLLDDLFD
jgi:hypothetical protein